MKCHVGESTIETYCVLPNQGGRRESHTPRCHTTVALRCAGPPPPGWTWLMSGADSPERPIEPPCSLSSVCSVDLGAVPLRSERGLSAVMRLSRPLETRMTRLERPRRRRAERVRGHRTRTTRSFFKSTHYTWSSTLDNVTLDNVAIVAIR